MIKRYLFQKLALAGLASLIGTIGVQASALAVIFTHNEIPDAPSTGPGQATAITLQPNDDAISINGFLDLPTADSMDVFNFQLDAAATWLGMSIDSSHLLTSPGLTFELFSDAGLALDSLLGTVSIPETPGGNGVAFSGHYSPGTYYAKVTGSGQGAPDYSIQAEFNNVPEPSTILGLLAVSGLGLGLRPKKEQA